MAITDKLSAIGDAIREKTNTSEKITLSQMPEMISAITGGGTKQYVNFYDYDGTLLHQYPLSVFSQMNALPKPPNSLDGCECTGWNYSIDTIKEMNCHVNVAAIYKREDQEVEVLEETESSYVDGTKLYFHIDHETLMYFYFRQSIKSGVIINWGDGKSTVSGTSYGSSTLNVQHTYQPGDYVMTFDLVEGCVLSLGSAGTGTSVIGSCNFNSTWLPRFLTLKKVEIDLRNTIPTYGAFRYCIALKEVIFGNGNNYALTGYLFDMCYALENVKLSTNITGIGDYAFRQCYRLRNIDLPKSITTLAGYAFLECRRLHEIRIPGTIKTINSYAFQNCTKLKRVVIGSGVQTIGTYAFGGCLHLKEVDIPNTVKTMNTQCFYQCYSLRHVVLPSSITTIPNAAFQSCLSLKTVVIPEGVKTIASSNTFYGCTALGFVGLPLSLTSIADGAFSGCYSLRNAVVGEKLATVGSTAFANCYSLEYVILPQTVTSIGINAYQNCAMLKNIIIPEQIMNQTGAFPGCDIQSEMMRTLFERMIADCSVIRDYGFDMCRYLEKADIPSVIKTIGSYAFRNNYALREASVPDAVTSIGGYGFQNNYRLKDIQFPDTLTTMGSNVFEFCVNMEKVEFPVRVSSVGATAFSSCYGLEKILVGAANVAFGSSSFANTYGLERLLIEQTVQVISFAQNSFTNSGIESVSDFPKNTSFGEGALFSGCYALESADVSGVGYTSINSPNSMFLNNYALTDIKPPQRTSIIGSSMFQSCFALGGVVPIGEYVDTINSNAFYDCRNLEGVDFLGNMVTTINSNAFYNCYSMQEISVPYNVAKMQTCFTNCFGLSRVYMYPLTPPTGVSSIGNFADNYVIYVPKGHQAAYETQWSSHKGHFTEFEYMIANRKLLRKTISLHDTGCVLKNGFVYTDFEEGQTFTITNKYSGTNLSAIKNLVFDYENSTTSFDFDRAETMDYDAVENITFHIQADGTDVGCDFSLQLKYIDSEMVSEYEVTTVSGYAFIMNNEDYYVSSNTHIQNSYALCKVTFTSVTGKLYVDCIGEGEANYDFGILSTVDQVLSSNNNVDSGGSVKKSFYGAGKYNQTVEYDIDDTDEHFIYIKFRKDGSVDTGADNMMFQIRFEEN